jgi:hypothetical protein
MSSAAPAPGVNAGAAIGSSKFPSRARSEHVSWPFVQRESWLLFSARVNKPTVSGSFIFSKSLQKVIGHRHQLAKMPLMIGRINKLQLA